MIKKRKRAEIKIDRPGKEEYFRLKLTCELMELRKKQGITQKELAKKIGTTQSVIARIEAGRQNLTVDYVERIASALKRNVKLKFTK